MIVAKIQVTGAIAHTVYRKVIPAGIIGAQVEFEYDEDVWSGLHKTVVFRGPVTKDVVTDANIVMLPQEIAEKPLYPLSVGVYGMDTGGNLVIPTIWADLGTVCDAANPSGDTTTDPSLPVWMQIQSMIGNLEDDLADKVPKKDYAPETKTESMTQPVGKDENGKLWTAPSPDSGGNAGFTTDETLSLKDGVLSVNTTNDMEQDNTLPITSAGVYATVGNIEALLKTI